MEDLHYFIATLEDKRHASTHCLIDECVGRIGGFRKVRFVIDVILSRFWEGRVREVGVLYTCETEKRRGDNWGPGGDGSRGS